MWWEKTQTLPTAPSPTVTNLRGRKGEFGFFPGCGQVSGEFARAFAAV